MNVEKCNLTHLANLAQLFDEYRVYFEQPSDIEKSKEFLRERLSTDQAVVFVAIDESTGEYMGFTLLYPMFSSLRAKATWTLNDMYITEKYRKFGVATKLLEEVRAFGTETGAQWVMLKTQIENTKAQALYDKFGFTKDDTHYYYYLNNLV